MYDVVIIGAGPAGLTAAIYSIRAGLSTIVLESSVYGGQVALTDEIENYPSIKKISGWELAQNIYDQAKELGAEVIFEQVSGISEADGRYSVNTDKNSYPCRCVIIANGAKRRKLGCPGEAEFTGRGVSYCAVCDGAFFRGKTCAVIGGGNSALSSALYLSKLCEKVYLIHRRDSFSSEQQLTEEVLSRENVNVLYNHQTMEITGDKLVTGVLLQNTAAKEQINLPLDAVFVAIGMEPDNSMFADILEVNEQGYLIADEECRSCRPGIFVAGDTRTKEIRQIITAASDGAIAATHAADFINMHKA